jgi:ABC-2 type transport system permease protein
MYASPIIYPISLVPSWLANLIKLNPLYYYIDCFRSVMIYGRIPTVGDIAICFFYAVAMLMLGLVVFRKNQDKFVLYI